MPITKASGNSVTAGAKGDLVVGSATNDSAILAVGNNGETLVADSSASTGLRWQGNFAAGKNKLINGDFRINQRAFASTTSNGTYIFDRWRSIIAGDGTSTFSAQTFTTGTAPVAGYEGINFLRIVTTGQTATNTATIVTQRIESGRTFAGETVTLSFWAKASSGTPKVGLNLQQNFGTGGSASTQVFTTPQVITISSSWARYSATFSVPSISGKTFGTSNDDFFAVLLATSTGSTQDAFYGAVGIQSATIEFWGVQLEAGSVATAFQTATGTLAGELAACQRYFQLLGGNSTNETLGSGFNYTTTNSIIYCALQNTMRTAPSVSFGTGVVAGDFRVYNASATPLTVTAFNAFDPSPNSIRFGITVASGLVAGDGTLFITNSTTGKLFVSAEL